MARVDPEDDAIERFIVRHYRYDPERRERRHVVVAVFDNEPEFSACIERVRAEIERRREAGEPVDPREHASGVVHEPGYLRRAANGHLAMRAVAHGAAGPWLGPYLPDDKPELMVAESASGSGRRSPDRARRERRP